MSVYRQMVASFPPFSVWLWSMATMLWVRFFFIFRYSNFTGFAMSKPHMRADLERQLQAICAGTRAKQEVLEEQKTRYRRIFDQSEAQILRLSQALQRYFGIILFHYLTLDTINGIQ